MPTAPRQSHLLLLCGLLLGAGLIPGAWAQKDAPHALARAEELQPAAQFYCDQALAPRSAGLAAPDLLCRSGERDSSQVAGEDRPAVPAVGSVLPVASYLPYIVQPRGASSPPPSPAPLATLLKAYLVAGPQPDYEFVRYRPRQFAAGLNLDPGDGPMRVDDPGPYAGWDVLNTPSREINTVLSLERWLQLTLNRPAQVAIVWRGATEPPAWLAAWAPGGAAVIDGESLPTYTRALPAGDTWLGAVQDPSRPNPPPASTYLVLLAEADGKPSVAPSSPAGQESPRPNQTCPAWVHDQYVTVGPDGKTYRTWHPQIDPLYWCYFHHEHGSNPGAHKPAFGYAAGKSGVDERHEGFKVYRFLSANGVEFIVTHHFGTASAAKAACVRFHTFDMAVYQGGVLAADLHLMADHGKSQHARSDADLQPAACPNQAAEAEAEGSNGVRKFQVASLDPVGYEPWRLDFARVVISGLDEFLVNTPSRIADCDTLRCDSDVPTGDQGEFRFVTYGPNFGIRAGAQAGEFYTDPRARTLVAPAQSGAVRQFVAPGLDLRLPALGQADIECYQSHPFGGAMTCSQNSPLEVNMNLEGALRSPN